MDSQITWMPHAGHFICGERCQFRLNTHVNGFIISTVGEFVPVSKMDGAAFEEIGYKRLYETMVFKAKKSKHGCCAYVQKNGNNIDFAGYNKPTDAYNGHMKFIRKYSKQQPTPDARKERG